VEILSQNHQHLNSHNNAQQADFNIFHQKFNVRVKSGELSWSKILELIDLYLSEHEDENYAQ